EVGQGHCSGQRASRGEPIRGDDAEGSARPSEYVAGSRLGRPTPIRCAGATDHRLTAGEPTDALAQSALAGRRHGARCASGPQAGAGLAVRLDRGTAPASEPAEAIRSVVRTPMECARTSECVAGSRLGRPALIRCAGTTDHRLTAGEPTD